MRGRLALWGALLVPLPAFADQCGGALVQICPAGQTAPETFARKVVRPPVPTPDYRTGDPFPVEDHSVLLDPARYGLAPVSDDWRYYAVKGIVYRVSSTTARVIDAVRSDDARLR